MIALKITETKNFMAKLLTSNVFDAFLLEECTITTFNTFHIDGHVNHDFYKEESENSLTLSLWGEMRPLCYQIIRGKNTPLNFKFVFHLSPSNTEKLLQQTQSSFTILDVHALVLSVRFDGSNIQCTTGTSLSLFSMDKSLEQSWDSMVKKFFTASSIPFEEP